MDEFQTRLDNIRQQKISSDNVYQFLLYFDLLYDKFTDSEKKEFLQSFVELVEVFPEEQPGRRFLKRIKFLFPIFFEGAEVENMRWNSETTVESVVTLLWEKVDGHINISLDVEELGEIPHVLTASELSKKQKPKITERKTYGVATYPQIKAYVFGKIWSEGSVFLYRTILL